MGISFFLISIFYSDDNKKNNYKKDNNQKDYNIKKDTTAGTKNIQYFNNNLQTVHPFLRETRTTGLTRTAGLLSRLQQWGRQTPLGPRVTPWTFLEIIRPE